MRIKLIASLFLFLALAGVADAYENLSVNIGGGYAGNLFADSFNIGNSYLVNNVSVSTTNFQKIKLKLYYGISYYEYDTDNRVNNFFHVPGFALYRKNLSQRFKWGIESFAAIKDYVQANSNYDNYRIITIADMAYYIKPGVQAKAQYKLTRFKYLKYGNLNNYEHSADGELIITLPSKTTLRGTGRYAVRRFDEDQITFHWFDTEFGASQSIDMRTGLSITYLKRWSRGGERPLSSYFIISGITSYWDPWDGNQIDIALKRILPFSIVSKSDGIYWERKFTYDKTLQQQLPWLNGKTGRRDRGWLVTTEISRQFNLHQLAARSFRIALRGGYLSNHSDDPFYRYNNFSLDSILEINIF